MWGPCWPEPGMSYSDPWGYQWWSAAGAWAGPDALWPTRQRLAPVDIFGPRHRSARRGVVGCSGAFNGLCFCLCLCFLCRPPSLCSSETHCSQYYDASSILPTTEIRTIFGASSTTAEKMVREKKKNRTPNEKVVEPKNMG
jgi:hypothetical protein